MAAFSFALLLLVALSGQLTVARIWPTPSNCVPTAWKPPSESSITLIPLNVSRADPFVSPAPDLARNLIWLNLAGTLGAYAFSPSFGLVRRFSHSGGGFSSPTIDDDGATFA